MTSIETAKLNGLDPQASLADMLDRIHDHKINRLDALLSWNRAPFMSGPPRGRLMAITHIRDINYAAKTLGQNAGPKRWARTLSEDIELLEAIICSDDTLTYGNIVNAHAAADETVAALTDDGIKELKSMLRDARVTTKTWHECLDDVANDTERVARIKTRSPP